MKMRLFFVNCFFFKITFDIRKVGSLFLHHRVSIVEARRIMYNITLKGQFQNLTSDQSRDDPS